MKKLIAVALAAASLNAAADNEFMYIANRAGGTIFFTYSRCVYVNSGKEIPHNFYVYSTDKYGNKGSDGCYEYKHPFYMVKWNGGGTLSVPVSQTTELK